MKRKKLRLTPKQAEHMLFNVLEIGSRMLVSGAEVQRVENSIYRMCTAYGSETTEVFCMTYMLVVTISSKQFGTITLSRRIHNLSLNLYELLYLNALSRRMCSTLPDMKTVDQKIRQIKALPKYGPIPSMLIYALISSFIFSNKPSTSHSVMSVMNTTNSSPPILKVVPCSPKI